MYIYWQEKMKVLQFALGEDQSGGSLATRLIVEDLGTDEYLLPQYILCKIYAGMLRV
jgi:hypothetical protein